jgi:hypothetical protein
MKALARLIVTAFGGDRGDRQHVCRRNLQPATTDDRRVCCRCNIFRRNCSRSETWGATSAVAALESASTTTASTLVE